MGGSKTSSVGNSNQLSLPRRDCNEPMKTWVSNTIDNPNRKFWKCQNSLSGCRFFMWDDYEIQRTQMILTKCCEGEMTKVYLM